jgi:hypothetical protein
MLSAGVPSNIGFQPAVNTRQKSVRGDFRRAALNLAAITSVLLSLAVLAIWLAAQQQLLVYPVTWSGDLWELRASGAWLEWSNGPQVSSAARAYQVVKAAHQSKLLEEPAVSAAVSGTAWRSAERAAFDKLKRDLVEDEPKLAALSLKLRLPEQHSFSFPSLILVALLPAALWLATRWYRKQMEHSRLRERHCRWCGYDIHETPYRCPECGKPVSTWAN